MRRTTAVVASVTVAALVVGGFASAQSTGGPPEISHDRFAEYAEASSAIFGNLIVGSSCADWPNRAPAELQDLVVVPATNQPDGDCVVAGWAYLALPEDLPVDAVLWDGQIGRAPIFDSDGRVVGHFASSEMRAGSVDPAEMDNVAD